MHPGQVLKGENVSRCNNSKPLLKNFPGLEVFPSLSDQRHGYRKCTFIRQMMQMPLRQVLKAVLMTD